MKNPKTLIIFATHNKSLVNKSDLELTISNGNVNFKLMSSEVINLKVHSQFSICEGAVKINQLSEFCKKNNISAVGICDNENLSGALEFSEEISKFGIQPIIGTNIFLKEIVDNEIILWKNFFVCKK